MLLASTETAINDDVTGYMFKASGKACQVFIEDGE